MPLYDAAEAGVGVKLSERRPEREPDAQRVSGVRNGRRASVVNLSIAMLHPYGVTTMVSNIMIQPSSSSW